MIVPIDRGEFRGVGIQSIRVDEDIKTLDDRRESITNTEDLIIQLQDRMRNRKQLKDKPSEGKDGKVSFTEKISTTKGPFGISSEQVDEMRILRQIPFGLSKEKVNEVRRLRQFKNDEVAQEPTKSKRFDSSAPTQTPKQKIRDEQTVEEQFLNKVFTRKNEELFDGFSLAGVGVTRISKDFSLRIRKGNFIDQALVQMDTDSFMKDKIDNFRRDVRDVFLFHGDFSKFAAGLKRLETKARLEEKTGNKKIEKEDVLSLVGRALEFPSLFVAGTHSVVGFEFARIHVQDLITFKNCLAIANAVFDNLAAAKLELLDVKNETIEEFTNELELSIHCDDYAKGTKLIKIMTLTKEQLEKFNEKNREEIVDTIADTLCCVLGEQHKSLVGGPKRAISLMVTTSSIY